MNFDLSGPEKEAADRINNLFDDQALAEIGALEEADPAGAEKITARYLTLLAEQGFLSLGLEPGRPEELLPLLSARKALAAVDSSLFMAVEYTRLVGGLASGWGGEAVRDRVLAPLVSGDLIGAAALTDPGGDEPSSAPAASAQREGREYVLHGRKSFTANGPIAGRLAVAADLNGRTAYFFTTPGAEGLEVGPRLATMGFGGLTVCEIGLAGLRVPEEMAVVPEDDAPARYLRRTADTAWAVCALGLGERVLHAADRHARTRFRGRKPLYAHQEVRFKLADIFTLHQAAELLIARAVWAEASRDREAGVLADCAKVFAAEAAEKIASLGMQIMAGQGYIKGGPVERAYRDAKLPGLAGTTSELARMMIAGDVLERHPV